ncbi:PIN domain-containing protein [Patescibacteria group bacterium]|nr:PIN domain-containing protein [Patescibacteria group bacterium]MBU4265213.1 PIN domain-containing protein [Patescibacteria group bacterium]MBU4389911.1 PIN domain-containing protein [Patescibacteria group bacterium]MCG2701594.1 PIN domain-containing protein [Candidatus Parcubacteria bacterium]
MVLLDTNFLIVALAGKKPYSEFLKKLIKTKQLMLSVIVVAEFLVGASDEEEKVFNSLLRKFGSVPIDLEIAQMAALYRKKYGKLKRKVYLSDCLIAATCRINGYKLATFDKSGYPMKDLEMVKI